MLGKTYIIENAYLLCKESICKAPACILSWLTVLKWIWFANVPQVWPNTISYDRKLVVFYEIAYFAQCCEGVSLPIRRARLRCRHGSEIAEESSRLRGLNDV